MAPLRVACAAEGRYDAHSAVMLNSVAAHAGSLPVEVHYLHGPDFPRRSMSRISEMLDSAGATVRFHLIQPVRISALPVRKLFTGAMWYRIFLPELVPDADRMLYLDVDAIATSSLEPLWETDLTGHYVAAVTNVLERHEFDRADRLGLPPTARYFNSGVLLMNLDAMRQDDIADALLEYAVGRDLDWPDQDALNVVLGPTRLDLHPRWNVTNSMWFPWAEDVIGPQVREARERPGIRHFEGPGDNKPWHRSCRQPHRDRYLEVRAQTPWRGRLRGPPPYPGRAAARRIGWRVGDRLKRR